MLYQSWHIIFLALYSQIPNISKENEKWFLWLQDHIFGKDCIMKNLTVSLWIIYEIYYSLARPMPIHNKSTEFFE